MLMVDSHKSPSATPYRNGRAYSLSGHMASELGKLRPDAASGAHSGLKSWQICLEANEIKFCTVLDRSSRIAVSRKCDVVTPTTVIQDDADGRQTLWSCGGRGC